MNVLLSIKPKYVDEILAGNKIFEFRKAIFKKKDLGKVFIYSSSPVKKVVASFEIARIIADSPQKLWDKCHKYGGIPENDFFEYYKNSDIGYAIEITNLEILSEPFDPYKFKKDFRPPQSYCYLPLDYFEKKSYPKTSGKKYEALILAEENEEYNTKVSALDEDKFQFNQSLESTEVKVGWADVTLNDIAKWGSGGTPKSTNPNYYGGNLPWLIIGDLNDGYVWESDKTITEDGLKNSSAKIVAPESVLVAMYGSIGKLGINKIPVATNQAIAFTEKLYSPTNNKYLFYYLLFSRPNLYKMGKGGTQRNISQTVLKTVDFPLPPLPEQRAIVSKIEQLFSELDNGITNLKLAQEQLKVYRQAVLKKAFEGELTREWRKQQTDLPDAKDLLEQIRVEREEDSTKKLEEWKRAVKEWEDAGKEGKKPTKPRKSKESKPIIETELVELPKLPNEWAIARMEQLSTKVVDGVHKKPNYVSEGVPFVTVKNLTAGEGIDFKNLKYISEEDHREFYKRANPELGDILITKDGTLGVVRVIKTETVFSIFVSVAMMKPIKAYLNSNYLSNFLESPLGQKQTKKIGKGSGLKHLHLEDLRKMIFFLPSLPEQQAIVTEIETRLSVCDKVEQDIEDNLKIAEALRQSILKKAFEGKLLNERELDEVRSVPDWEPAEALLERIRAEKANKK